MKYMKKGVILSIRNIIIMHLGITLPLICRLFWEHETWTQVHNYNKSGRIYDISFWMLK